MKTITVVLLIGVAGALSGCSALQSIGLGGKPGHSVEFIAGNASTVLIDYDATPADEVQYAAAMAAEKCKMFDRSTAVLSSVNTRSDGRMRAEYSCK